MTPLSAALLAASISGLLTLLRGTPLDQAYIPMTITFGLVYGLYSALGFGKRGGR